MDSYISQGSFYKSEYKRKKNTGSELKIDNLIPISELITFHRMHKVRLSIGQKMSRECYFDSDGLPLSKVLEIEGSMGRFSVYYILNSAYAICF